MSYDNVLKHFLTTISFNKVLFQYFMGLQCYLKQTSDVVCIPPFMTKSNENVLIKVNQ